MSDDLDLAHRQVENAQGGTQYLRALEREHETVAGLLRSMQRPCRESIPSRPPRGTGVLNRADLAAVLPGADTMSATEPSGVRERLVEAAAEAAREAQGAIPGSSYRYPESVARTVGFHVLTSLLPLIADHIEAVRDGEQEGHYEVCSLTNVADMLRSWSS